MLQHIYQSVCPSRACAVRALLNPVIISLVSVARLQASQAASAALAVMRCLSLVSASVALPMALYKYVYDYDYDYTIDTGPAAIVAMECEQETVYPSFRTVPFNDLE